MRDYNALKLIATLNKIAGYVFLFLGLIVIIITLKMKESIPFQIKYPIIGVTILISFILFVWSMATAQSILLMIDLANDLKSTMKNTYFNAKNAEKTSEEYERKTLLHQQQIAESLSKLVGNENSNFPKINLDDI